MCALIEIRSWPTTCWRRWTSSVALISPFPVSPECGNDLRLWEALSGREVTLSQSTCPLGSAAKQQQRAPAARKARLSGGRPAAADVPDEVLAGQDGGADAANEQDQHPDGVEAGRDQPERADDQPEQDDQGNRSDVFAVH